MVDGTTHIGFVFATNPARRELRIKVAKGRKPEFEELEWIHLALTDGESMRCRVASARPATNAVIVVLTAGATRDSVARMKGAAVVADESALTPRGDAGLDPSEWIGFKVRGADGTAIGDVAGVLETKANDVLEIERAGGGSMLLPAIEQVILEIDMNERIIVVGDLTPYAVVDESDEGSRLV